MTDEPESNGNSQASEELLSESMRFVSRVRIADKEGITVM